ncbi:MAG TPA: hypothetical protein VJV21_02465 [Pyrinomonadaceae bacterium]|nr:hypothetical protein [Pyrinomonadaceae bacterium]
MAKKSSGEGWALLGLGVFVTLAILISGRGQENSPLVPDFLEDQIDFAVDALNKQFGHQWATLALDKLQGHLERTYPQIAWLIYALLAVEQQSIRWLPMAKLALSQTKKQNALRMARGY